MFGFYLYTQGYMREREAELAPCFSLLDFEPHLSLQVYPVHSGSPASLPSHQTPCASSLPSSSLFRCVSASHIPVSIPETWPEVKGINSLSDSWAACVRFCKEASYTKVSKWVLNYVTINPETDSYSEWEIFRDPPTRNQCFLLLAPLPSVPSPSSKTGDWLLAKPQPGVEE